MRFSAPAAPAAIGRSSAVEEISLVSTICRVATSCRNKKLKRALTPIVTRSAEK
jgi:hypothetical protein